MCICGHAVNVSDVTEAGAERAVPVHASYLLFHCLCLLPLRIVYSYLEFHFNHIFLSENGVIVSR